MAKSALHLVAPTEVIRTVAPGRRKNAELRTREHLTAGEFGLIVDERPTVLRFVDGRLTQTLGESDHPEILIGEQPAPTTGRRTVRRDEGRR